MTGEEEVVEIESEGEAPTISSCSLAAALTGRRGRGQIVRCRRAKAGWAGLEVRH